MPGNDAQYFDPEPRSKKSKPRDCIDQMCTHVNQELLISKLFYFFFFAAFGSLFPLLAVYFKQLGMNATQSGMLIGFRPFIEFLSAPFWGNLADKWRKGKQIMLFALFSWVAFTLALAFIQPTVDSCLARNHTGVIREDPLDRSRRDTGTSPIHIAKPSFHLKSINVGISDSVPLRHRANKRAVEGKAPVHVRHKRDDDNDELYLVKKAEKINLSPPEELGKSPVDMGNGRVSPAHSSIVYREQDVREVFFLLLLVVVIGEFFSAPAITLGDSCTLAYLGDDVDNYGRQRMFGSLGWGLAMFFVGIALDHSTTFPEHPCAQQDKSEKNYTICFAVFSVLMSCAFISATQFRFMYNGQEENIPLAKIPGKMKKKAKDMIDGVQKIKHKRLVEDEDSDDAFEQDTQQGYQQSNTQSNTQRTPEGDKPLEIKLEKDRDMVYDAMQTQEHVGLYEQPKWLHVFRLFCNLRYGSFLFLAWFMGFGIGLIFTFLFWHLQDLGGSPTLFGMASVINHISEIFAYFFSSRLIGQIGHVKLLYIGLVGNVARFLYISWLKSPWWVLPFEFAQGVTHALVWAASVSYITNATPAHLKHSAQGILQGLHHGLGRGCGAVFGGIMVHYLGSEWTFRIYGFLCIAVLVFFVAANYFSSDVQTPADFLNQDKHEPKEYVEETSTLAPCGVPMNPMSRNLSNSKLAAMESEHQGYGATGDGNGYLQPHSRKTDPWNEKQNGYQSGTQGLFMSATPPVQTETHYQQPEGNENETQYQYNDNW